MREKLPRCQHCDAPVMWAFDSWMHVIPSLFGGTRQYRYCSGGWDGLKAKPLVPRLYSVRVLGVLRWRVDTPKRDDRTPRTHWKSWHGARDIALSFWQG